MAKLNPAILKRPAAEKLSFKWETPNMDAPLELLCRKMTALAWNRAYEEAQALTATHITGIGTPGEPGYIAPEPLPPTGGRPTEASYQGFSIACLISAAQVVAEESDRYTPQELIAFMQDDLLAGLIALDAQKLRYVIAGEIEDDPNPPAAPIETS